MIELVGGGATAGDIVMDAMAAAGLGTPAQDLFCLFLPDGDIDAALGTEVPGLVRVISEEDDQPHLTMGTIVALEGQRVQVIVRGAIGEDPLVAKAEALRIRYTIGALSDFESRGLKLLNASPQGSLLPLGRDARGREQFSLNFRTTMEPAYREVTPA